MTLLVLLSFLSASAKAECDGTKCAEPLAKGQRAPFEGQLLSTELAIDLGLKAEQCDARLGLEKQYRERSMQIEISHLQRVHTIDLEAAMAREKVLEEALSRASPWYKEPMFIAAISVAGTVAVFFGAVYALEAVP